MKSKEQAAADSIRKQLIRSAVISLSLNLVLAAMKFLAARMSGSLAVTGDAANNFSDACGSLAVLLSAYISTKPEDREHPYGHGRMEYVSALVVGFLIFTMAVDVLKNAIHAISHPEQPELNGFCFSVMLISIIAKFILFLYQRSKGKRLGSDSLVAESRDSLADVVTSALMLIGLWIGLATGVVLDSWLGLLAGLMVLWEGYSVCRENGNRLLGGSPDPTQGRKILKILEQYPDILGIHDLQIHDYGPWKRIAIAHAEVDANQTVLQAHHTIDQAEQEVFEETGIQLCMHIDPVLPDDDRIKQMLLELESTAEGIVPRSHVHDIHETQHNQQNVIMFDVKIPESIHDTKTLEKSLKAVVGRYFAEAEVIIRFDLDYFDE